MTIGFLGKKDICIKIKGDSQEYAKLAFGVGDG